MISFNLNPPALLEDPDRFYRSGEKRTRRISWLKVVMLMRGLEKLDLSLKRTTKRRFNSLIRIAVQPPFPSFPRRRESRLTFVWIPACAGMTVRVLHMEV